MRWQWHFGLGKELGYAFWALTFFEAVLGAYAPIWPLWIEHLGAPISIVGLVLASSGIFRPFILGPGAAITDRYNTRNVSSSAAPSAFCGLILAAVRRNLAILFVTVVLNALGELVFPTIHAYVADHAGDDPGPRLQHDDHDRASRRADRHAAHLGADHRLGRHAGGVPALGLPHALRHRVFVSRMDFGATRLHRDTRERVTYRKAFAAPRRFAR